MTRKEQDYVLGTHDAEIGRLQLQHGVWRQHVRDCWQRAGIAPGMRVVDIGCGPGFASADLAECVGAQGEVIGIERSERFIAFAENHCRARNADNVRFILADVARNADNVRFILADVMQDALPVTDADAVWCRWLAIFVSDPALLVRNMAGMLKPGGKLIFHEYVHYETYQSVPPSARIEEFIAHVMRSWREFGGEPNVARYLPAHLAAAGCRVLETRPISFSAQPHQPVWQWPASFIDVNLQRLLDLGLVDAPWVAAVKDDMRRLEADPNALLITPMVLEIIAEKA